MKQEQDKKSEKVKESPNAQNNAEGIKKTKHPGQQDEKDSSKTDNLYQFLKPLHNLPRGKKTWDPQIIKKWWFWPVSALFIIILYYVYPYVWDFFSG